MADPEEKERRKERIKIRKTWNRNPGMQVHENKKKNRVEDSEQDQIAEGLNEFEEGL